MAHQGQTASSWRVAYGAAQTRLREPLGWYPYPAFITIGLILLLTSHLVLATNPRMGHPASVINFPSESFNDSALWFSMTAIDRDIVVTTNDRRVFRWPQDLKSTEPLEPFVAYLKRRVASEIEAAAVLKLAFTYQTTAVIAADQRLKYLHLRPVLTALAAAGITNYAFETQNIATFHPPHAASGGHAE